MEKFWTSEDKRFVANFKKGNLPEGGFDHKAHLRLAWLYLVMFDVDQAIAAVKHDLLNYVQLKGATDKYHETVTIASIKTVRHFINKSYSKNFEDFVCEFPRLTFSFKELLNAHYSYDLFQSEKAKIHFVEPDLLPYD